MDLNIVEVQSRGRGKAACCSSFLHKDRNRTNGGESEHLISLTKQENNELVNLLVRLVWD